MNIDSCTVSLNRTRGESAVRDLNHSTLNKDTPSESSEGTDGRTGLKSGAREVERKDKDNTTKEEGAAGRGTICEGAVFDER